MDPALAINLEETRRVLVGFIRDYVHGAKAEGVVLGLSGGIDSALVAALAVEALGPRNVLGLILPHESSSPEDEAHARLVATHLGMAVERIDITPVVKAVHAACDHSFEGMAANNLKPRSRMLLLYAHANSMNRLVAGTGNKSELMTGYFTKYGDGGADLYPLGDLYKTQVFALSRQLGLPREVVDKPPTAGLYPGQTDEGELGIAYRDLDRVLAALEGGLSRDAAAARAGVEPALVGRVLSRIESSEHKRTSLVIPKVGFRTPGADWRLPRQPQRSS
ncbi:MAG TPA: NAD+ synthase [Candidatus Thermoplasmatota archaeon]|nr:NAD+ synthase [Candidatus Thermoplasmatota archaeon]